MEEERKELKKRLEHNKKLTEAYEKQRVEFQRLLEVQTKAVTEMGQLKDEIFRLKECNHRLEVQIESSKK